MTIPTGRTKWLPLESDGEDEIMQRVTTFLWFNDQAEEAVNFYVSVFSTAGFESKVLQTSRYSDEVAVASGRPKGSVMTMTFELAGQKFMALNGGPQFQFTPAISLMVNCDTQQQIDHFWDQFSGNGGTEVQCGWVTDRFGLSWQIVPTKFGEWMKDPQRAKRVMAKLITMKKLVIAELENA